MWYTTRNAIRPRTGSPNHAQAMAAEATASPVRDRIHAGTGIDVRPACASATRTDSGRTSRPTRRRSRRETAARSSTAMAARQAKAIVRPATTRRVLRVAIPQHLADHVIGIESSCEQLFPDFVRHVHQRLSPPVPRVIEDAIVGEARDHGRAEIVLSVLGHERE